MLNGRLAILLLEIKRRSGHCAVEKLGVSFQFNELPVGFLFIPDLSTLDIVGVVGKIIFDISESLERKRKRTDAVYRGMLLKKASAAIVEQCSRIFILWSESDYAKRSAHRLNLQQEFLITPTTNRQTVATRQIRSE